MPICQIASVYFLFYFNSFIVPFQSFLILEATGQSALSSGGPDLDRPAAEGRRFGAAAQHLSGPRQEQGAPPTNLGRIC